MNVKTINSTNRDKIFMGFVYLFIAIALFLVLYPLIYVISASISSPTAVNSGAMWLLPKNITWEGYKTIFTYKSIWQGYRNTIYYTGLGTLINLAFTLPCAYALGRPEFFGKNLFMKFLMVPMFIGGGLVPTYLLIKNLNMVDSVWALVIPGAVSVYNIAITRTFFQSTIPREMEEAALMDGCSDFQMFIKIVLPLSMPIIAVMGLFCGVGHWNSYFSALIYLTNKSMYPLQLILREILVNQDMAKGSTEMTAAAAELAYSKQQLAQVIKYGVMIVSTLPIIMIYPFLQKYFVKGVMVGSLKG
nr:carbohydrate ABC transporter permease [Enterococcus sp. JM9B]